MERMIFEGFSVVTAYESCKQTGRQDDVCRICNLLLRPWRKTSLKGRGKTIFGNCIATQEYADSIRADGYALDTESAMGKVKELLGLA